MKKQRLSLLLAVCMLLSILPMNVPAADANTPPDLIQAESGRPEETAACTHTAHTDCAYTAAMAEYPCT